MILCDVAHSLDEASFPDLDTLADAYQWSRHTHRVFERLFGLKSTSLHQGEALEDGLRISAAKLAARNPDLIGRVDLLIYCHALNDTLPFGDRALEAIGREIFRSQSEVLSVTHGSCASAIIALHLLGHQRGDGPLNIVLLTGEKCFFEILNYAENNGIFGETTSAAWLRVNDETASGQGGKTRVAATVAGAFGGVWAPLAKAGKDDMAAYDRAFMPTMLGAAQRVMDKAGIGPGDVGLVLPTHLSPFTFNRVADRLGICDSKVVKQNLNRIGHCFCGDLFINFQTWADSAGPAETPVHVLSFAAGMTGSYAAIILTKETGS